MQESKNVPLSSIVLLRFYKAWMADHFSMDRTKNGLCNCLINFLASTLQPENPTEDQWITYLKVRNKIVREMKSQFICANLSYVFPFNMGFKDYEDETRYKRCHENPLRVQWVEDRIQDCLNNYEEVLCEQNKSH